MSQGHPRPWLCFPFPSSETRLDGEVFFQAKNIIIRKGHRKCRFYEGPVLRLKVVLVHFFFLIFLYFFGAEDVFFLLFLFWHGSVFLVFFLGTEVCHFWENEWEIEI